MAARQLHPYQGVRHPFAAYDPAEDKLYGNIKPRKTRLGSWSPAATCAASTRPTFAARSSATTSPHLTTRKDKRNGQWAAAIIAEVAYTPSNASWRNRIPFHRLRHFALDGTDHASHKEQANIISRYIIWRNNHAYNG